MIKEVAVTQRFCDFPGCEESAYFTCQECGTDYCSQHKETNGRRYPYDFLFYTTLDGEYCLDCDARLRDDGDPLHRAFLSSEQLGAEWSKVKDDLTKRKEKVRLEIDRLRQQRESDAFSGRADEAATE